MKRRSFIQAAATVAGTTAAIPGLANTVGTTQPTEKEMYEFRIYQLTRGAKTPLMNYLTSALIPAINRLGGKVGIFSEYSLQEPPKLYVLIVYPEPEAVLYAMNDMENDPTYLANAAAYLKLPADKPLFERVITNFMVAFDKMPALRQPNKDRGLFELRIYESNNEDAGRRKILMFNKEEIPLFDKVGLPAFFFGKNVAGNNLPALTYMLWFRDMAHREEAWAKFGVHPEWIAMKDKPEYANTVSKVNRIFLLPEKESQI